VAWEDGAERGQRRFVSPCGWAPRGWFKREKEGWIRRSVRQWWEMYWTFGFYLRLEQLMGTTVILETVQLLVIFGLK
jgi:hypothetical protein